MLKNPVFVIVSLMFIKPSSYFPIIGAFVMIARRPGHQYRNLSLFHNAVKCFRATPCRLRPLHIAVTLASEFVRKWQLDTPCSSKLPIRDQNDQIEYDSEMNPVGVS